MLHHSWRHAAGVAMTVLLVGWPGLVADEGTKKPADKDGKQPNPLQALQDAFNKGVTTTVVEPKDLPKEIIDGVAKQAPDASIKKAEKQEIKHTLKYVALDKPKVKWYQVIVANADKRVSVQVAPDGKKLAAHPVAEPKSDKKETPPEEKKEIAIPEKAAKAVKAIKDLYPNAVVIEITTEVYQDPSGTIDILTYEVEFLIKGKKKEMVASPEGVIPHLVRAVAAKDLPKAVVDTVEKEVTEGKITSASAFEIRAGLQFTPLDKPRVVYKLQLEKNGKASALNLRADGSAVPAPVRLGPNRAYLGLSFEKNTTTVSTVVKDGPAAEAGVKAGDKLVSLDDAKVGSVPELLKLLQKLKPGTEVTLKVQRDDKTVAVKVKLGTPPG